MAIAPTETLGASLRDYYAHAELRLAEPMHRFHQYKCELANHHFLRLKDTIRTSEDLRKWLVRLCPINCYVSVNPFLQPSQVSYGEFNGKKAGYNHFNNYLLGDGALVFDTDHHDRPFQNAKQDCLTTIDYLKESGYSLDEVHYSGMGWCLIVTKHDLHLRRTYSNRNNQAVFDQYRQLREPIVKAIQELGVQLDAETTLDPKRVIRCVNTPNSKTGIVCTVIRDVARFTEHDASELRLKGVTPVTTKSGMTKFSFTENEACRAFWGAGGSTNIRPETETETKPYPASSAKPCIYLATHVIGTKGTSQTIRQVIMLSFKQTKEIMANTDKCKEVVENLKKRLSQFAESQKLAPFIVFRSLKDPENLYALSPSAVQTDSLKRLLRRLSNDRAAYAKFKRRIVPLPVEYAGQSSGVLDTEKPVSRAHWNWMKHYGLVKWTPQVLTGNNFLPTPIGEMRM